MQRIFKDQSRPGACRASLLAAILAFCAGIAQPVPAPAATGPGWHAQADAAIAHVEPALQQALAERGQAKALVYLREQADLTPAFGMDRKTIHRKTVP